MRYQVKVEVLYASGNYQTTYLGWDSRYGKFLFNADFKRQTLSANDLNRLARDGQNFWSLATEIEE